MTRDQFVLTGCAFLLGLVVGSDISMPLPETDKLPAGLVNLQRVKAPFIAPAMGLDRYMDCPSTGRRWQLAQKADRNPITIDCAYMDETLDTEEAL